MQYQETIIIGCGVSGIAAAYYLSKNNINYLMLEQSNDIGGTWRDHNFHGCRVDTENVEYCFSFNVRLDKTTRWNKSQVMDYLKDTVIKFNILPNILFNKTIKYVNFSTSENKDYFLEEPRVKFHFRELSGFMAYNSLSRAPTYIIPSLSIATGSPPSKFRLHFNVPLGSMA